MRKDTGRWSRNNIAAERSKLASAEELRLGFRGAMTDDDMSRYARCLTLVYGPAPEMSQGEL